MIKSESKPRNRMQDTPKKDRLKGATEVRLSLKELPQRAASEERYGNVNVGFDGMLTFSRFR